ncbi:protein PHR1-LIKE 2 isoform X1 [Physcomitrium patens]|uniref:protein PHR1-LIKE 2 isoform X1 n=1 Tax=Physcomitrium patens TaxID=3218 RepID=UPI003CCE22A2
MATTTTTLPRVTRDFQITEVIRIQMEVQRRLQEQLEVQKQLQLRINAHRKYLQTILEKAKEALASHIEASPGLAARHADLTELASKVNSESVNISFPPLTLPSLPTYSADAELFDLPRQQSHVSHCSLQKSCVSEVAGIP